MIPHAMLYDVPNRFSFRAKNESGSHTLSDELLLGDIKRANESSGEHLDTWQPDFIVLLTRVSVETPKMK